MQNKPFTFLFICTFFTVVGMGGGFMAGSQVAGSGEKSHEEGKDKEGAKGGEHAGHDHGKGEEHEEAKVLSVQALKNLRVEVKELDLDDYTTYRGVSARIESTPKTVQSIIAPFGGTVQKIEAQHGELVKKGTLLMTLMRDSIARPELKLTQSLLDPEQRLKGLSVSDISAMSKKSSRRQQVYIWKTSLKRFGYWSESAELILKSLPEEISALPFCTAVIGELLANGYLGKDFVSWIKSDQSARKRFFEIASLLLEGKGLAFIKNLNELGALEPLIEIVVPNLAPDYDVHHLDVKIGDHVEMGQVLGELHNPRELHIEAHARGSEIPLLMHALEKGLKMAAVSITKGAGESLQGLSIRNIFDDSEKGGATVHLEISGNPSVIKTGKNGKQYRSWKVRVGSRYILRVPQKIFKDVFVLPADAVVEDGADKIVFMRDGDTYKPCKVVLLYQNDEISVLSQDDSDFFPGDSIVVQGALGLSLALKEKTGGGGNAHAGHSH